MIQTQYWIRYWTADLQSWFRHNTGSTTELLSYSRDSDTILDPLLFCWSTVVIQTQYWIHYWTAELQSWFRHNTGSITELLSYSCDSDTYFLSWLLLIFFCTRDRYIQLPTYFIQSSMNNSDILSLKCCVMLDTFWHYTKPNEMKESIFSLKNFIYLIKLKLYKEKDRDLTEPYDKIPYTTKPVWPDCNSETFKF